MPRKYDVEMLKELAAQPKKKGGRPKKYHTEEERRIADAERHRKATLRARLIAEGKEIPEELRIIRPRRYMSDEDRALARKQQAINTYYRTHEQHKLNGIIYWYRKKIIA